MKNTIQRIVAIAFMFSLCAPVSMIAAPVGRQQQIKFTGFEFNKYKPETVGLEEKLTTEVNAIIGGTSESNIEDKNGDDMKVNPNKPYALVGHSQGGLRVLATAVGLERRATVAAQELNYIDKTDPKNKALIKEKEAMVKAYENLEAVITVSGINRGLKALSGGLPAVQARVQEDADTIYRGVRATAVSVSILGNLLPRDGYGVFLAVAKWIPGILGDYIAPALDKDVDPYTMAEIRDMIPRSEFIKKNVLSERTYTFKVLTGTRLSWEWRSYKRWIFRIYYLVPKFTPVYSNFTFYKEASRLDPELPIGYIVGLNSNTLEMSGEEGTIRKVMTGLNHAFLAAEIMHWSRCWLPWNLFSGRSVRYALDASAAREWVNDIDGQLNELKGSNQNDGLVALESQFLSKSLHDKRLLDGSNANYVTVNKEEDHQSINPFNNGDVANKVDDLLRRVQN